MSKTIYHASFQSRMKYGIIFWGRDRDSVKVFRMQKKVIQLIFGIMSCESCRHIFMDYKILTMASLYILEVLCFIKRFNGSLELNSHIHDYNTRGKMDLHVQGCNQGCGVRVGVGRHFR
jgi:hypothetical protein